ncbi:MAG: hypothetical protein Q8Q65_03160 [bacterium]|nr:hypothetical protein [bacterium]
MQKPKLDYLRLLTTQKGILQHSSGDKPNRKYGYALDDNARALVVAELWYGARDSSMKRYVHTYLENIARSQAKNGKFYCYLYDNGTRRQLGTGDWFGRSVVALAFHVTQVNPRLNPQVLVLLRRSLRVILDAPEKIGSLRLRSQLVLASYYLMADKGILHEVERDRLREILVGWGQDFKAEFNKYAGKSWVWPENRITYDNGKVIQAYLLLGKILENQQLIKIGQKMLSWYLEQTMKNGYFQAPGNNKVKFWKKGDQMPLTDEQPLEAYSLITALVSAKKIDTARQVYEWYFGKNRLGLVMVDGLGGVYDGLRENSVNLNLGAENVVGISLAYFAISHKLNL